MAFIPSREAFVGKRVRLTRDITTIKGTFTNGHEMIIIWESERGYDLEDDGGNRLLETKLLGEFFEVI